MTGEPSGARGESPATASEQGLIGSIEEPALTATTADPCGGDFAALPSTILPPPGATGGGEDAEAIRREKR